MSITTSLKVIVISLMISSPFCFSDEVPSNSLQVEYKQYNEDQITGSSLLSLDTVYQIPKNTYNYLDQVFTSFYNTITFNSTISESTFEKNPHYELISIPLIAENKKGIQFELFGNFTDPGTQRLSNFSDDQALSTYYSNTEQLNMYDSELSLGAGFSFNTNQNSKVKILISSNNMPGYGTSNALVGFETSF